MKKILLLIAIIALGFSASAQTTTTTTTESIVTQVVAQSLTGYKEYVAIFNQSGSNAPTVTIIKNELNDSIAWIRLASGLYQGALTGGFTLGKTVGITSTNIATGGQSVCLAQPFIIDIDNIGLTTYRLLNQTIYTKPELEDGLMFNQVIILRVYD